MPLRIQCNNCGKLLILGPGAGTTIICPACGAVQQAPAYDYIEDLRPAVPVQPPFLQMPPPTPRLVPIPASPLAAPKPPRKNNYLVTTAVAFAVVALFICAMAAYRYWSPAPSPAADQVAETTWEADNLDKILSLSDQAEQLVFHQKLTEAYAAYKQLEQLVAGHTILDPNLRQRVEEASQHEQSIFQKLLNGGETIVGGPPQPNPEVIPTPTTVPTNTEPPLPPIPTAKVSPPTPTPAPKIIAPAPTSEPAVASPPPPPHQYRPGDLASDADVGAAIQRGVDFLITHMKNGEIDDGLPPQSADHAAQQAMVVYALLTAGQTIDDPRLDIHGRLMATAIDRLKRMPLQTDPQLIQAPVTYGRAIRAQALALYNRPEDQAALADDVAWLVHAEIDGAYTFDDRLVGGAAATPPGSAAPGQPGPITPRPFQRRLPPPVFDQEMPGGAAPDPTASQPQIWDNFNSAAAVMGVAAGCSTGISVSPDYWRDVQKHWTDCQLDDGSWSNTSDHQIGSTQMNSAGVASLLAAQNALDAGLPGQRINVPIYPPALANGLAMLAQADNSVDVFNSQTVYLGYNLIAVENAGLISGYKHFGRHDWYGELAAQAIVTQWPSGSWGRKDTGVGAITDTSCVVTFLARGRHPVMMAKLEFPPVWDNRPRDIANLAQYASITLGRPVNWEAVEFDHDWSEWTDAPILYIASHRFPQLRPEDEAKLRDFAEAGGILFTNADAADASFDSWSTDLAKHLFPQYPMTDIPTSSPLYLLQEKATGNLPPLKGVSNGVRLLMVHAPSDLALAWQQQDQKSHSANFAVGLNLYVYADGGTASDGQQFRNRLDSPAIIETPANPQAVHLPIARLRYSGEWDPEPGAWRRMSRVLDGQTNFSIDVTPIDFSALNPATYPFAHLTGVGPHDFSDADAAAVRDYVQNGGTLLIDACGGSTSSGGPAQFAASVENGLIPKAFDSSLRPLTATSPLLLSTVRGMTDLTSPRLRPFAADQSNTAGFRLMEITSGQGRLIYSPLDLTSGLLGTHTWGIAGYDPAYAAAVVRNLVIWAASHRGM